MAGANVPKLRFPGFSGEWEEKKFGEIIERISKKYDPIKDTDKPLLIELENIESDTSQIINVEKVDGHLSLKTRFNKGDVLFGKLRPYLRKHSLPNFDGACTSEIWVFRPKETVGGFIFSIVQSDDFIAIANQSSGSKMPRAEWSIVSSYEIKVPSPPEQTKIAEFLGVVDEKIKALRQKHRLLKDYKRGIMQKIFTQQIRFKKDDGTTFPDWEEKRLSFVFSERSERDCGHLELLSVSQNNGVTRIGENNRKNSSSTDKSNYKKVCIGDIAYNSMRMWQGASGVSSLEGIVSPAYTVIIPKTGQFSSFWGYYFKYEPVIKIFQSNSQGLTSDTWNLKFNALSTIKFKFPILDEQQKIADFLSSIDNKIDATQSQIDQMTQFKKGLLQQMFV